VNVVVGGFWEKEGGGGGYHEEAVLVVHPVLGQDSGQEVKTRGPVESCNVCSHQLGRSSINIDLYQIYGHLAVLFGCMMAQSAGYGQVS